VPLARDTAIRRRLASLATEIEAVRLLFYRIGWMLQEGLPTPYETALCKVMADELGQAVAAFGMEMLGLYAPLTQDSRSAKLRGSIQHLYQTSMGQTIAGHVGGSPVHRGHARARTAERAQGEGLGDGLSLHGCPDVARQHGREFLRHRCPPAVLEDSVASERGFSAELWKEISLLGWPGLLIPPDYGGSGGSLLDVSLLIEEMGRACFPSPYVPSAVVATSLLVTAANPAQRERLLPALARGDRICTLALTEDSASFERDGLGLEGDVGGKLTGRKLFVKDAHVADDLIVVTRGAAGPIFFCSRRSGPESPWLPWRRSRETSRAK